MIIPLSVSRFTVGRVAHRQKLVTKMHHKGILALVRLRVLGSNKVSPKTGLQTSADNLAALSSQATYNHREYLSFFTKLD